MRHVHQSFVGQEGIWSTYVENQLIPRLNGFELLMASYAMAHLKLDLLLKETGYRPSFQGLGQKRFNIFLTNSLEESHPDTGTIFANWLSAEANEANRIKRDTPVMVVMGNPPYSVSSTNKSEWIENLVADYKKNLNERNIQPLSDDYIKFIRFGQHFIEKNGEGILAYISNNSFLDGLIHRQMRKSLLESFDKIYIIDLHGNSKKKETAPDGSVDQNLFDIMQGVSINIFVKSRISSKSNGFNLQFFELFGSRKYKYEELQSSKIGKIDWVAVNPRSPDYFLVPKRFDSAEDYQGFIGVPELFKLKVNGVKTHRDHFVVSSSKLELKERIMTFYDTSISDLEISKRLDLADNRDWKISESRSKKFVDEKLLPYVYRPFDYQTIYYEKELIDFGRFDGMHNLNQPDNHGLILVLQSQAANLNYFDCLFVTNRICDTNFFRRGGPVVFPLYTYPKTTKDELLFKEEEVRMPNLNMKLVYEIEAKIGLSFTTEKIDNISFAPIDILDYIYGVLHSPNYREKYKEFLKIDFPRVPYPKDAGQFWKLVEIGGQIRQVHLLESPVVSQYITRYPKEGDNVVEKPRYEKDKVWINDNQYFEGVPAIAWNFYIGGYQPAQKWLKDRKGRTLGFEDILHYQKIIVALTETDRLMKLVDEVGVE